MHVQTLMKNFVSYPRILSNAGGARTGRIKLSVCGWHPGPEPHIHGTFTSCCIPWPSRLSVIPSFTDPSGNVNMNSGIMVSLSGLSGSLRCHHGHMPSVCYHSKSSNLMTSPWKAADTKTHSSSSVFQSHENIMSALSASFGKAFP